jgi:hypothetical protein
MFNKFLSPYGQLLGVCGGAVGLGTALQAGRLLVQFLMV